MNYGTCACCVPLKKVPFDFKRKPRQLYSFLSPDGLTQELQTLRNKIRTRFVSDSSWGTSVYPSLYVLLSNRQVFEEYLRIAIFRYEPKEWTQSKEGTEWFITKESHSLNSIPGTAAFHVCAKRWPVIKNCINLRAKRTNLWSKIPTDWLVEDTNCGMIHETSQMIFKLISRLVSVSST